MARAQKKHVKADLKPPHLGSAYLSQLVAKLDFHLNSGFLPALRGAFLGGICLELFFSCSGGYYSV